MILIFSLEIQLYFNYKSMGFSLTIVCLSRLKALNCRFLCIRNYRLIANYLFLTNLIFLILNSRFPAILFVKLAFPFDLTRLVFYFYLNQRVFFEIRDFILEFNLQRFLTIHFSFVNLLLIARFLLRFFRRLLWIPRFFWEFNLDGFAFNAIADQ